MARDFKASSRINAAGKEREKQRNRDLKQQIATLTQQLKDSREELEKFAGKFCENHNPLEGKFITGPMCPCCDGESMMADGEKLEQELELVKVELEEAQDCIRILLTGIDKHLGQITELVAKEYTLGCEVDEAKQREKVLVELFNEYRDHVCTCAPLTWASTNNPEYTELAYAWEKQWEVLDRKARAELKDTSHDPAIS